MQISTGYSIAAIVWLVVMLVTSDPLRASEKEDRPEASARQSHMYQTYLKEDAINFKVDDGVVTLTVTALNQAKIDLASERVAHIRKMKSAHNHMIIEDPRSSIN